jgi:hypothetical protein
MRFYKYFSRPGAYTWFLGLVRNIYMSGIDGWPSSNW